ncbi:MAG: AAA family ATPase [Oryzomonas sp.]|uniref:AAA family ATPase n=1 Tax=Oryzomonas sp. TaxID=2855186 RepID=UPI00283C7342|nr:AAA family ATPase [Oryzomonas sp.]MDR3578917.1 AAA family ATPase [Oryzomonas sp.]
MTAIILVGIPASGKSTFCRQWFFFTHVRVSLDMLKTRHRERLLVEACLAARQPYVVDNTNASAKERARFIGPAKASGFRVVGYYLGTTVEEALEHNRQRHGRDRIPDKGVVGVAGRLELPTLDEGFDGVWHARVDGEGGFVVEEWREDLSGPL